MAIALNDDDHPSCPIRAPLCMIRRIRCEKETATMTRNRQFFRLLLGVACLTLVLSLFAAGQAQRGGQTAAPTVKEQEVAPPFAPGTLLTLSQKGMRVASTRAKANGKWIVQIDGMESPEYDEVLKTVPTPQIIIGPAGDITT